MWTANRKREGRTEECAADQGVVTLGGDPAAVYLGGERRWVSLYTPGGYQWRPKAGDKVLVVKAVLAVMEEPVEQVQFCLQMAKKAMVEMAVKVVLLVKQESLEYVNSLFLGIILILMIKTQF